MGVAVTAIAVGTVVTAGVSYASGQSANRAATRGARTAAAAQTEGTRMEIDELRRQFDYQQRILLPQIQQQYNAQRAYSDLLGIGGPEDDANYFDDDAPPRDPMSGTDGNTISNPRFTNPAPREKTARELEIENRIAGINDAFNTPGAFGNGGRQTQMRMDARQRELDQLQGELDEIQRPAREAEARRTGQTAYMGRPGSSGLSPRGQGRSGTGSSPTRLTRDASGAFVDPNLDRTSLRDSSTYADTVRNNLLAPTDAAGDEYINYVQGNRVASATPEGSRLVQRADSTRLTNGSLEDSNLVRRSRDVRLADGAAGTGVYGENFQESVGYGFSREEMERQLQRQRSAGGPNIGGRAIMEAQRRAKGLADQEYYNWAAGRTRDLERRAGAESTDIGRGDSAVMEYERQRLADVGRGDQALAEWERQRLTDVGRDDEAYGNYLTRRAGDASRLDSAASDRDRLTAVDLQRRDQGYYNYLAAIRDQAGFGGGPASQAVQASANQGSRVGNAFGNQGNQLAGIYGDLGVSRANIARDTANGIGSAVNDGLSNYVTYRASR